MISKVARNSEDEQHHPKVEQLAHGVLPSCSVPYQGTIHYRGYDDLKGKARSLTIGSEMRSNQAYQVGSRPTCIALFEKELDHRMMKEPLPQMVKGFDANHEGLHMSVEAYGSGTHQACRVM